MSDEIKISLALITSFALAMLIAPLIIRMMRALKAGQPILKYVDKHEGKSGTPTMGGIIFLLPTAIVTAVLYRRYGNHVELRTCWTSRRLFESQTETQRGIKGISKDYRSAWHRSHSDIVLL